MKYLFVLLLISSTASASLLEPIFECRNDNHSFSLVLSSRSDATIHYKKNICPIKIVEISHRKGRVGADGLNLNFVVSDCHKKIFYNKFRIYFITDGYKLKFLKVEELQNLIIKFVRMSEKKDQEIVINEIKAILRKLGEEGF